MASVTIVMPYWNDPLAAAAVESLRAQTFTAWRLVVVVDGCDIPDLPVDRRVDVLRLPVNAGFSNAVAEGLADTDTEWWTVHDSDDWSEPDRLEYLVDQIGARSAVLAPVVEHPVHGPPRIRPVQPDLADGPLRHVAFVQAGLYRTDVARDVGWNRTVRYAYDSVFTGLVFRHHDPVVVDRAQYHLVRRAGSLSTHRKTSLFRAHRRICEQEWAARR